MTVFPTFPTSRCGYSSCPQTQKKSHYLFLNVGLTRTRYNWALTDSAIHKASLLRFWCADLTANVQIWLIPSRFCLWTRLWWIVALSHSTSSSSTAAALRVRRGRVDPGVGRDKGGRFRSVFQAPFQIRVVFWCDILHIFVPTTFRMSFRNSKVWYFQCGKMF
jgi:hypothetical protein